MTKLRSVFFIMTALGASLLLTSCAVVGYSSGAGWFFWPGGWIGILIMLAITAAVLFFWQS